MQSEQDILPYYVTIESTDSPIQHLLHAASRSPATIAPERIPQLRERFLNMDLTISNDNRFQCEALPNLNTVRLSRRVVELAWAFAYSYWEIYQAVFDGRTLTGEPIDWHTFDELVPALRLLRWAQQGLIGEHEGDWPAELPRPDPNRPDGSSEHVADEMALCVVAMYLHHELAHIDLQLENPQDPMEEERLCDSCAANWILGSLDLGTDVLQKRAMGVAIGMLMLTVRGLSHGNRCDGVHPQGYERLVNVLRDRVPVDQRAVWGVVVGMLAIHVNDLNFPANLEAYDDYRDAALGYCDHIRMHLEGLGNNVV
ncbi:MAG: phage exclusion protein Lit family protein [Cyanobacteriota bacterium]|nr:phage exclusion protein Lit family protein [Cyanobacteriota bacterium]